MKRVGPELKMPDLKGLKEMNAPAWLADLYWDMRERRLLLPLALVVVAIAAVPFLLGDSEAEVPPPVAAEIAAEGAATGVDASTLTVVEATPGLRDYKKRLKRRDPTDPFVQKYTSVPGSAKVESTVAESPTGSGGGGEAVTTTETEDGGTSPSGESTSQGGSTGGSGDGGSGDSKPPRLFAFAMDVQISRSQKTATGQTMSEPVIRRKVKPFTQLPEKETPVVTTMSINLHTGKLMFLISDRVTALKGDFECVARTPDGICELLEVERGFPFEVIYGPADVLYRFKVIKVTAVWDGRVGDKLRAALDTEHGAIFGGRHGFAAVGQFRSEGGSRSIRARRTPAQAIAAADRATTETTITAAPTKK